MKSWQRVLTATFLFIVVIGGTMYLLMPRERILLEKRFSNIQPNPEYYYVNFTVDEAEPNPALAFRLEWNTSGHPSFTFLWILYNKTVEEFEASFNMTWINEVDSETWMNQEDSYWCGGYPNLVVDSLWNYSPISPGNYVFVFWVDQQEPPFGWSGTLQIWLRTSLFPVDR